MTFRVHWRYKHRYLILTIVILGILLATPGAIGYLLQRQYGKWLANVNRNVPVQIKLVHYKRGWLTSKAELQVTNILSSSLTEKQYYIEQTLTHGINIKIQSTFTKDWQQLFDRWLHTKNPFRVATTVSLLTGSGTTKFVGIPLVQQNAANLSLLWDGCQGAINCQTGTVNAPKLQLIRGSKRLELINTTGSIDKQQLNLEIAQLSVKNRQHYLLKTTKLQINARISKYNNNLVKGNINIAFNGTTEVRNNSVAPSSINIEIINIHPLVIETLQSQQWNLHTKLFVNHLLKQEQSAINITFPKQFSKAMLQHAPSYQNIVDSLITKKLITETDDQYIFNLAFYSTATPGGNS